MWIAVLGMHRSGTSAIAGILHTLGFHFGENTQALAPTPANPKGYWERLDVLDVNDELLAYQKSAWDQLLHFQIDGWTGFQNPKLEARMRSILADLDREPAGFIKDPRLCLTLPVWARIIPPTLLVWVRRSPNAVAKSLKARTDCTYAGGLALWEVYDRAIQAWARDWPTIQVHFEAFQADPWKETQALAAALQQKGLVLPVQPDRAAVSSWFDPGLIRNTSKPAIGFLNPPENMLNYQSFPVRDHVTLSAPPPISPFASEHMREHEMLVRPLKETNRQLEALYHAAVMRVTQLEDRLNRLEKAEAAFARSRLWRFMRILHRLVCRMFGRTVNLHPMDKIHAVLYEEKRPCSPNNCSGVVPGDDRPHI